MVFRLQPPPMCPTARWHSSRTDRQMGGRTPQLGHGSGTPQPRKRDRTRQPPDPPSDGGPTGGPGKAPGLVPPWWPCPYIPRGWSLGGPGAGGAGWGTTAGPGWGGWERGLQPLTPRLPARPRAGSCQTTRPRRRRRSWEPAPLRAGAPQGPRWDGAGGRAPRWLGRTPQHLRPPCEAPACSPPRPLLPAPGAASPAPAQLPLWLPSEPPPSPCQFKPVWRGTGPRGFPDRVGATGMEPRHGGSRPPLPALPTGLGSPTGHQAPHPAQCGWGTWGDPSAAGRVPGLWATPLLAQPGCPVPPPIPSCSTKPARNSTGRTQGRDFPVARWARGWWWQGMPMPGPWRPERGR